MPERHIKHWLRAAGRQDDEAIELAFSKKKIEERKAWLAGFEPGTFLDQSVDQISYSDFVNKAGPLAKLAYDAQCCHALATGQQSTLRALACQVGHRTCTHTSVLAARLHTAAPI